ncbi:MAG TPA: ion transporter [Methanotrichaceae archaeon]|nr:ion transporter [Methanotrichaceae archaeon]
MIRELKRRIYQVLEEDIPGDRLGDVVNFVLVALILLNALAVILETEPGIYNPHKLLFRNFASASIAIFILEYMLRLWVSDLDPRYSQPLWGRLWFALTPLALIDLAVILPYILPIFLPDLRYLRAARIFWIFRLLKMARYSESLQTIENVIRSKRYELAVTFMAILFFLVISSSMIYYLEHSAQPQNFPSIPATMWWSVLTLTTIGSANVYPVTPLGKFVGSFIIILGVGMFALPTGILTSGFVEELQGKQKREAKEEAERYDEGP